MPISRKQFERGMDPAVEEIMGKINHFLTQHKDEAYADLELAEAITSGSGEKVELEVFKQALVRLMELAMAEKKVIGDTEYYSCKEKKRPTLRY